MLHCRHIGFGILLTAAINALPAAFLFKIGPNNLQYYSQGFFIVLVKYNNIPQDPLLLAEAPTLTMAFRAQIQGFRRGTWAAHLLHARSVSAAARYSSPHPLVFPFLGF